MRPWLVLGVLTTLTACGGGESGAPPEDDDVVEEPPPACVEPNRWVGDACLEPGVADDGCPPGTLGLGDGSCRPAGIEPTMCGEGFAHDGDVGCLPTLPAAPCPTGEMAVPGDTSCHPVMECGSGPWGDIPIEAGTLFVDASAPGMGDGSEASPFATIQAAVEAAATGAQIAIAAGSYLEEVVVDGKAVRLRGRCPSQVELVAPQGASVALRLTDADDSDVQGMAISGESAGIYVVNSRDVVLERLWIHGNQYGVVTIADPLVSSFVLRDSLVEATVRMGVYAGGGEVELDGVEVRDTEPDAMGGFGRGLNLIVQNGEATSAVVQRSVFSNNTQLGVFIGGADVTIDSTVIRDTRLDTQGQNGRGLSMQIDPATEIVANVAITRSLLERNRDIGIFVGAADLTLEATVLRETQARDDGFGGRALSVQNHTPTGTRGSATVKGCLFEDNHHMGLFIAASDLDAESTVVRDTLLSSNDDYATGVHIQQDDDGNPSQATLRGMLVERNEGFGVGISGSDVTLANTLVRATLVEATSGLFGDGVLVSAGFEGRRADVALDALQILDSGRAGIANFGGSVVVGNTAVQCALYALHGEDAKGQEFTFENLGHTICGCTDTPEACAVVSTGLEPPPPVDLN